jgi:hypothetical protein
MDDFFIAEYFDWKVRRNSYIDRLLNRVFGKIGLRYFPASFVLDGVDTAVTRIEGRRLSPLKAYPLGSGPTMGSDKGGCFG